MANAVATYVAAVAVAVAAAKVACHLFVCCGLILRLSLRRILSSLTESRWGPDWHLNGDKAHEQEIVLLQELRIGVLPYTFTND